MALSPHSVTTGLWPDQAVSSVTHWVRGLMGHKNFSPEETLAEAKNVDPRLLPRVPMTAKDIDTHLLAELGKLGFKRGKLITDESHPELMQAWRTMSARAGMKKPPQLILAESDVANALAVSPEEVVVTTGLFKMLDAREVVAVLGHEFAHEKSDHQRPRIVAMSIFGGAGVVLGDRFAHQGGIGQVLRKTVKGEGRFKTFLDWKFGTEAKPVSVLGSLIYMAVGGLMGTTLANHLSVRPTELDADAKSVAISGDPQALISALSKLEAARPVNSVSRFFAYLQSGYPTTKQRIGRLQGYVSQTVTPPLLPSAEPVPVLPPSVTLPGHTVSHITADTRVEAAPAHIAVS